MKVLGIDFSHKKKAGGTYFLLEKSLEAAKALGAEVEIIRMADYNILPCIGCGECMNNKECPLLSNTKDDAKKLYDKCYEADSFIFAYPVYALLPPASVINFLDRAPQTSKDDLNYDYYSYDKVKTIKGKCFKGKIAGLIASSAGMGHDYAMGVLHPTFTAIKLTVVAAAGISLMEYDQMPQFKKFTWSKAIEEADFAIDMVTGVGKRVVTGTKAFRYEEKSYSPNDDFKEPQSVNKLIVDNKENNKKIENVKLVTLSEEDVSLNDLNGKYKIFLIGKGPMSSDKIVAWSEEIKNQIGLDNDILIQRIAIPGELPVFITRDFIKSQMQKKDIEGFSPLLLDWDNILEHKWNLDFAKDDVVVMVCNTDFEVLSEIYGDVCEESLSMIKKFIN